MTARGAFTVSLDTELAWGSFDKGHISNHEEAYRNTGDVVDRLCARFDEYDIPATWAFVAHLFEECTGHTNAAPSERAEWLSEGPCLRGVDRSLWYAPELLETVQACTTDQDIGLHGYSHLIFSNVSRRSADAELAAAIQTAQNAGIDPVSFVFPRNEIGHVDLLADHGFEVYRGRDARWYEQRDVPSLGRKPLRFVDEGLQLRPPTVVPHVQDGVVCVPGSQVFRPAHGPWAWTPAKSQYTRAKRGLEHAAETGQIFHLWFHPFNLGREPDSMLATLERILAEAARLAERGEIDMMTLSDISTAYQNGRWQSEPESQTMENNRT